MENEIATIKNVQLLFPEVSKSWASDKIKLLRDSLNKPKPQIITMSEFKKYFGVEI